MGARYYLPNTNRFLTPDTIVPDPKNPQSLNRYSYVNNNPINFSDPSGHRECASGNWCAAGSAESHYQPPTQLPMVTKLWIDINSKTKIQLYGNTNAAFNQEIGDSSYAYSQGFHGGLDLLAPPGTEVIAGIRGRVHWVGDRAYGPNYVVIEISANTYIVLGHLSGIKVQVGQNVTADSVVGEVADRVDVDHLHVEFWTGPGENIQPRTIEVPYQYMSPEVKTQFLGLMTNMNIDDNRITFHERSDGRWDSIYNQPDLIYNGSNLN